MRTKALLGAAILAAGALTSMAQSNVYSLNIVGYVNVTLQGGGKLDLLSYPLKPTGGNYDITNVITLNDACDGAGILKWAGTAWNNTIPGWIAGYGWDTSETMALGEAFFINSPGVATITFVGEVATGSITNTFNTGLNFVANQVPTTTAWPGGSVGNDGDGILTWNKTAWNNTIWNYIAGYGWDDGNGGDTNGPALQPAQGAVYVNGGAKLTFVQTFNP